MGISTNIECDGCNAQCIDRSYWLSVHVTECLPKYGGFSHGMELDRTFTYCSQCKPEILLALRNLLGKKESGHE